MNEKTYRITVFPEMLTFHLWRMISEERRRTVFAPGKLKKIPDPVIFKQL